MAKVNPKAAVKSVVDVEKHEADLSKRKAAQDKKQPKMRRMLNATAAAEEEARKPRDRYKVSCTVNIRSGGQMEGEAREGIVTAQNESDAWAVFCDQNKSWPSPKFCDRKIEKVA